MVRGLCSLRVMDWNRISGRVVPGTSCPMTTDTPLPESAMRTKNLRRSLILTLGLLFTVPAVGAAAPPRRAEDVCLVNEGGLNTLVFQDVEPLSAGRSVALRGVYFSSARRASAVSGSAVMASDGSVRLGLFVHSSATPAPNGAFANDFTLSGVIDATLTGSLFYDNDGDFLPNGTILFEVADCTTITIP